jgi:hypothetical protein
MDIIIPTRTYVSSTAGIFRSHSQLLANKPNQRPTTKDQDLAF